jgi:hypothetical protein
MFNWNRDWLLKLLKKFKEINKNVFDNLIAHYGLDVNDTQFLVDKIAYSAGTVESLRKLRFVYCFIRAASNTNFQSAQVVIAKEWITRVKNTNVIIASQGTKKVTDYITSEHGLALVVDLSVNTGLGNVSWTVRNAANTVLAQSNNLAEWGDTEEASIIDAYINERHNLDGFIHAEIRETRIDDANLSKGRDSYV